MMSSPSLLVLVNRSPTDQFYMEKGLHQGDPLSHFLFNLVVEVLSSLFEKARGLLLIKGAVFGDKSLQITHLQFVDDMILFIEPAMEYLANAKRIL